MLKMRRANTNEIEILNSIALESERIWGEDECYMELFSKKYKVTGDMIENDYVFLMEEENVIIGFFVILVSDEVAELELFYIEKSYIGKGYGAMLWRSMENICKTYGIRKIELVASDDVVNFYKKFGAKEIDKIDSSLKIGRIVSKLEYEIE